MSKDKAEKPNLSSNLGDGSRQPEKQMADRPEELQATSHLGGQPSPQRVLEKEVEVKHHLEVGKEMHASQVSQDAAGDARRVKLEKSGLPAGMISHIIINNLPDEEVDRMTKEWNDGRVVRRHGVQWGEEKA